MIRTQQDKEEEQRIFIEAIVDCYYEEERVMGTILFIPNNQLHYHY